MHEYEEDKKNLKDAFKQLDDALTRQDQIMKKHVAVNATGERARGRRAC
jgi:hypothetical protein